MILVSLLGVFGASLLGLTGDLHFQGRFNFIVNYLLINIISVPAKLKAKFTDQDRFIIVVEISKSYVQHV